MKSLSDMVRAKGRTFFARTGTTGALALLLVASPLGCSYVTDFQGGGDGGADAPLHQVDGSDDGPETDGFPFDTGPGDSAPMTDGPGPTPDGPGPRPDGSIPDAFIPDAYIPDAPPPDMGPPPQCRQNGDCNDNNQCTSDICAQGMCQHLVVVCPDDGDGIDCTRTECNPTFGCQQRVDHAACNDNSACTIDQCELVKGCTHNPQDSACNDGNPCTQDRCAQPPFASGFRCVNDPVPNCKQCKNNGECGGNFCRSCGAVLGGQRCTERCTEGVCAAECQECKTDIVCSLL